MNDEIKPLSKSEQVFISEYLKCFNATSAYMKVHPKSKRESAWANAARLIGKDSVKAEIQRRIAEIHMSADEALKRLSDMARGDIGEFITPLGGIDMEAARAAGLTPLVKKIKQRTITKIGKGDKDEDTEIHDLEIELYSAKDAIDTILRVGGKLKDAELTINVKLTDD